MNNFFICETLKTQLEELTRKEEFVRVRLRDFPRGSLRITHYRGKPLYYIKEGDRERYINKKERELAKSLAEKSYLEKLAKCLSHQINSIDKFLNDYSEQALADIFYKLSKDRRNLVSPIYVSNEDYAKAWQEQEYIGKDFMSQDTVLYTNRGERVRSKSEKIIADKLDYYGIPYKYECPLTLKGRITIHPDFTVLNVKRRQEYYWEHCGMMDDEIYFQKCMMRIRQYENNDILVGIRLILSQETSKSPLDTRMLDKYIKAYLL